MEDKLLGALIGLAKSTANTAPVESTLETLVDGLALLYKEKENLCAEDDADGLTLCREIKDEENREMSVQAALASEDALDTKQSNENKDANNSALNSELARMTDRVHEEKFKLVPDCALCQSPCGNTSDYDASLFRESQASNQKLNLEIIAGLEKIAYSIRQKKAELSLDDDISGLLFRALAVTSFDWAENDLLELKAEVDKYLLIC